MAIKIKFVSDIADFIRGTKKAEEGVDEVSDSLTDVARTGDRTEKQLEQNFRRIEPGRRQGGDKIKKGFKEAGKEAGALRAGGRAVLLAAASTTSPTSSRRPSRRRSPDSARSAPPPASPSPRRRRGAAGLAAQQEALEKTRDAARDLSETLYENKGALPIEDQITRARDVLFKERSATNVFEKVFNDLLDLGTALDLVNKEGGEFRRDFIRGVSGGDARAAQRSLEYINEELERLEKLAGGGGLSQAEFFEIGGQISQWNALRGEVEQSIKAVEAARAGNQALADAFPAQALEERREAVAAERQAWRDYATAVGEAGTAIGGFVTEAEDEAASFDLAGYLTEWREEVAAHQQLMASLHLLPPEIFAEAQTLAASGGAEAANAYAQGYLSADPTARAEMEAAAKGTGDAVGKAFQDETTRRTAQAAVEDRRQIIRDANIEDERVWRDKAAAEARAYGDALDQGIGGIHIPPVTVKVVVDDTAVRNYKPPRVNIYGDVIVPKGFRQPI